MLSLLPKAMSPKQWLIFSYFAKGIVNFVFIQSLNFVIMYALVFILVREKVSTVKNVVLN